MNTKNETNQTRELTIEEMIELGYSEELIRKALDRKMEKSQAAQKRNKIEQARNEVMNALKTYFVALGIPAEEVIFSDAKKYFDDFERQILPLLNLANSISSKGKESARPIKEIKITPSTKTTLDDKSQLINNTFEALKIFADSL